MATQKMMTKMELRREAQEELLRFARVAIETLTPEELGLAGDSAAYCQRELRVQYRRIQKLFGVKPDNMPP